MTEYINRERARFEAKRYFKGLDNIQEDLDMLFCMLPAEYVAPVRHGRWLQKKHKIFGNEYDYVCSECGCDYALAEYKYCPNCGAKMDGGAD